MHQLFSPGSSVLLEIFLYLVELDRENGADRNLQSLLIISSIMVDRSHLARVCREWSELLANNQTLSLASLHFSVFGCHGSATDIFTRYNVLKDFHLAACNFRTFFCKHIIIEFLRLPWRLRVAKLDKLLRKSDTFSREVFGEELRRAQKFFSPQTVALVEHSIAEFSARTSLPTRWPPASQRYSQAVYMQYDLLNFRWGRHHEIVPDEFVAWFKDVKVYPWRNLHLEHGSCWTVRAMVRLSSVLCLSPQNDDEIKCTCMFNFRSQSFGAVMRVFLGSRLDLTFTFVSIPPSILHV